MCSLHRFTRKKGIFRCNKRLKHCNPTIVSLCLKFSIDCFDETPWSIEPQIDIYSQLIPSLFFSHMSKQSANMLVTKEHASPSKIVRCNKQMEQFFLLKPVAKEIFMVVVVVTWCQNKQQLNLAST